MSLKQTTEPSLAKEASPRKSLNPPCCPNCHCPLRMNKRGNNGKICRIYERYYWCTNCRKWIPKANAIYRGRFGSGYVQRLNWKSFPKGNALLDIRFGQRLIVSMMREARAE